jgi:D-alanine-D-alanine ligase
VSKKVAIIYNQPGLDRYSTLGEQKAVLGVIDSVKAVHRSLHELHYLVKRLPLSPPLEQVKGKLKEIKADVVFNLFEGFEESPESEALVASTLSELGVIYTGCPGDVLALAQDKIKAKSFLKAVGIDTPHYQVLIPDSLSSFKLCYPCIVKPFGENASHGLIGESVVTDADQLGRQVFRISHSYGGKALVEEFVNGREFNITVWGNGELSVLPISEIIYALPPDMPSILTFDAKWEPQSMYFKATRAICPATISTELRLKIETIAISAFRLLHCSGYLRLDFRLDRYGSPQVLDINPNPDISPGTGTARQAKAAGMNYSKFIEKIVALALDRKELVPA